MATSGYFNTSSVGNFYFTIYWERTGYSSVYNEHYVSYSVTAHNTPGNYRTVYTKSLTINSSNVYYNTSGIVYYDGDVVTSGSLTISSYNSEGDGSISLSFEAGVGITPGTNCSGSDSWYIDRIPRYATAYQSLNSKTVNSIKINWSSDSTIDYIWYSKNGGSSWSDVGSVNASSGTYTISGLSPNTTYDIKTRVRRKDSQLTTDSSSLSVTTYQIAKLSSYPNFYLGNSETVAYSNPSGATISVGMYKTDGATAIRGYQGASGSSYTFNFSDSELDSLYKMYTTSNEISVRIYLRTTVNGISYIDYKTITVTLNGNQKTGHIKVSGSWKRSKKWINVNGSWKRCVRWIKVSGSWKRCI